MTNMEKYNYNKQLIRRFNMKADVVNAQVSGAGKEAIEKLFKEAQKQGLIVEGEERTKQSIDGITFFNDRPGGSINEFN